MENKLNFTINIGMSGNEKVTATIHNIENAFVQVNATAVSAFAKIQQSIKSIKVASIMQQIEGLANGFQSINEPGLKFESSLHELSALTGVTGKGLQELGKSAKASATEFGGNAASSLETYKTILSRLGPDIAKNKEALSGMERNVQILSKTMGGDAAGAVDALTTAMLQYGVDLSKPQEAQKEMARMMDIMANAAQEGAAEVPQISAALKVSGVAATQAKVSFAEANAAIQALAMGGKEGSEAGMALRNVLGKMAGEDVIPKEAAEKLKRLGVDMNIVSDKTIPFTQRLRELKKAQGDATIMAQVFGVENAAGANILINSVDAQDKLTQAIQKQGGAQEQANIVMESTEEKLNKMRAKIDNVKISLFELTGGYMGYLSVVGDVMRDVSSFIPLIEFLTSKQRLMAVWNGIVTASTWLWSGAQAVLNAVMMASPLTWIILAIVALIGVIVFLVTKVEGWGEAWGHTWNGAKLVVLTFVEKIKFGFNTMINGIMIGLNKIKEGWYRFKNAVGLGDEKENNKMIAQINGDTNRRMKEIVDGAKKVKDLENQSLAEFGSAIGSLKIKKGKDKVDEATVPTAGASPEGIVPPKTPGIIPADNGTGDGTGDTKKGQGSKSNESIATGGQRNTVINITMKNMVEAMNITGRDFKESANNMSTELQDQMARVLAMAVTTAG